MNDPGWLRIQQTFGTRSSRIATARLEHCTMFPHNQLLACTILSIAYSSSSHAISTFGAQASGDNLEPRISLENGGVGSTSASVNSGGFFSAEASLGGSTFTPILKAKSQSTGATSDDAFTTGTAAAYQTFRNTSSTTLDVVLNITLDALVSNEATALARSSVLADIFVDGGSEFDVIDSPICSDGRLGRAMFLGDAYFCGQNLERANLFTRVDDTLVDTLLFSVAPGEFFGVYGILYANSRDGTADAFNTLTMAFEDDTFIEGFASPSPVPIPAALWLFGSALGLMGVIRRKLTA
jgi:hypothetical protein